jgi:hypothetical protein
MTVIHIIAFAFAQSATKDQINEVISQVTLCQFPFASDTLLSGPLQVIVRFFALKEECLHSVTKEPYIKYITGGTNESKEGLQVSSPPSKTRLARSNHAPQGAITHIFMIEFVSAADRDYYVNSDPAPQKFKELVEPLINTDAVRILDFKPLLFK